MRRAAVAMTFSLGFGVAMPSAADAASASSQLDAASPGTPAYITNQNALDEFAGLLTVAGANAGQPMAPGFAGTWEDPGSDSLILYWHGAPNDVAQGILERMRQAKISATTKPADFDRTTLETARTNLERAGIPGITVISIPNDGSGLLIGLSSSDSATQAKVRATLGDLPITFDVERPTADDSRWNDQPASFGVNAGAAMWSRGYNSSCSTGFAVTDGSNKFWMTAAHCISAYQEQWTTPLTDVVMGTSFSQYWSSPYLHIVDGGLILGAGYGRVWDGGVDYTDTNGTGEFSKNVVGSYHTGAGGSVCFSGGYSGARCSGIVKAIDDSQYSDGHWVSADRVERSDQQALEGSGDSGGPVFSLTNNGSSDLADGVINSHDTTTDVACTGVPTNYENTGRTCGWRSWIARVDYILDDSGKTIVTS